MSEKHWSKKRLIVGLLLIGLIGVMWGSGFHKCLTFMQIKTNAVWLSEQVKFHYWWTVMIYLLTFVLVVVCSVPGTALMNILGGFLFGVIQGVIYINIGATLGATIFFFLVRYVLGSYLQERYEKKLINFNKMIAQKGWLFLIIIRCIPLIPFFMVNTFAGLTQIPVSTFVWTTSVGILPTSIIFAYAGKQLNGINQLKDLLSGPMMMSLGLLLALALLPLIINRYRKIF